MSEIILPDSDDYRPASATLRGVFAVISLIVANAAMETAIYLL
jgi:hypothetical protein